jgi:hypothetical protein
MKLFTKEVDKQLFAQYPKGSDLDNQMVVAKIFNPYGRGVWYLLNSDPEDPDYIWAIVDLFEPDMGSVSRSELQTVKVPPFGLGLERDIYFTPKPAKEVFEGIMRGERFAHGGMTAGRYYKDNSGNEFRYIGESEGKLLFKDGEKIITKSHEDFEDSPKEYKLFGIFAEGGRVKGINNNTGESYGVVIGSVKISDEHVEGGTEMNVRTSYSSRISEVKLIFDKNGNLYEIIDFGYALEGNYPDTSKRSGGRNYNADKKETLEVLSEKYNPAFAKKLIELAKTPYIQLLEKGIHKWYVVSAKEDKVVSKGFNNEEEAKKAMYDLYKKSKDFSLATRRMAEGGMLEHGLKIGDKITSDMFWDNQIVVENQKTKKRAQINLETGERKEEMGMGGDIASAEHNIKQAKYGARLVGKQKNLDVNKNGKLDAEDFKMLRGEKMAKGGEISKESVLGVKDWNKFDDATYTTYQYKDNTISPIYYEKYTKKYDLGSKRGHGEKYKTLKEAKVAAYGEAKFGKMAMGGKVKFEDKVKEVQKSLLKRKKVAPVVQKDYGKTYNRKEALESAKRIIGAQTAKWEKRNKK